MMLVNMRELLEDAEKGNYAVGSFSVANMEMVLGVLKAAEELNAPVILQIAEVRLKQSPLEIIGPLMVAAAENASTPVAVHFDHGKTIEKITEALDIGFTSVMFDGSHLPLEENIEMTKKVILTAEEYDAAVEAEIGCVGGSEDGSEDIAINCTKPDDAARFEKETGVDALAIAIGNAHGNYKSTPKLRFDILKQVDDMTDTPLVLHGGTGISPEDFVKCSKTGIKKINIATATFDSVENNVREAYKNGNIKGYYDLHEAEIEGAYKNAKRHILIFGSDNKA
ncbi:class II fructose-bisphosphate aldolase [uncultured Eubacterium sp.]|uniref:class II fructose-bisphosphate aldolase n=1 Tax=uncultured Eubacterium sp. TaxID=165185 RepID=UPI0025D454B2|nr:class II fructose-bisphosphate aldolase [uncultured Eubacterium sp.]